MLAAHLLHAVASQKPAGQPRCCYHVVPARQVGAGLAGAGRAAQSVIPLPRWACSARQAGAELAAAGYLAQRGVYPPRWAQSARWAAWVELALLHDPLQDRHAAGSPGARPGCLAGTRCSRYSAVASMGCTPPACTFGAGTCLAAAGLASAQDTHIVNPTTHKHLSTCQLPLRIPVLHGPQRDTCQTVTVDWK